MTVKYDNNIKCKSWKKNDLNTSAVITPRYMTTHALIEKMSCLTIHEDDDNDD
jgi:hypothetical protein